MDLSENCIHLTQIYKNTSTKMLELVPKYLKILKMCFTNFLLLLLLNIYAIILGKSVSQILLHRNNHDSSMPTTRMYQLSQSQSRTKRIKLNRKEKKKKIKNLLRFYTILPGARKGWREKKPRYLHKTSRVNRDCSVAQERRRVSWCIRPWLFKSRNAES